MEYVTYGVVIVLFIIAARVVLSLYMSHLVSAVLLEVYALLSFEPMLIESVSVRIATEGGPRVKSFLDSQLFAVFCATHVPGHNRALIMRHYLTEIQWQSYLAFVLICCLEVQQLAGSRDEELTPEELDRYDSEIKRLPIDLSERLITWRFAHATGAVQWLPGREACILPAPTIVVRRVWKLPQGTRPPRHRYKPGFKPQFA
jgi:hypothetical protein